MKPLITFHCRPCNEDFREDTSKLPSWASFALCDATRWLPLPALAPTWSSLETAPIVNGKYLLEVFPPFVFPERSYTPWIIFTPPLSHANSWHDSPDEIPLSSFVRVSLVDVLSVDENSARLKVRVLETIPFTELVTAFPPQPSAHSLPYSFLHQEDIAKSTTTFEDFAFVDCDFQGDVGEWAIFQRWESRWRLLALCYWDHHKNIVHVGHKMLDVAELRIFHLG